MATRFALYLSVAAIALTTTSAQSEVSVGRPGEPSAHALSLPSRHHHASVSRRDLLFGAAPRRDTADSPAGDTTDEGQGGVVTDDWTKPWELCDFAGETLVTGCLYACGHDLQCAETGCKSQEQIKNEFPEKYRSYMASEKGRAFADLECVQNVDDRGHAAFQVCMVFNMPHVPEGNSVIDVSVVCPKDEEGYPPDEEGGLNIYQAPPRAHANSEGNSGIEECRMDGTVDGRVNSCRYKYTG